MFFARHLLRIAALSCALVAAAACLPVTSRSPVGSSVGYADDPRLTGLWRGQSGRAPGYIAFFPRGGGVVEAVMLEPSGAGDKGDWSVFDIRTAALGADRFMDASETEADGKPVAPKIEHVPVLYRFGADGSLALYLMDDDAAKEAIRSGRIAGEIEPGQFGDVVVTAPAAALDAFLETPAGRALFKGPPLMLARVKQ